MKECAAPPVAPGPSPWPRIACLRRSGTSVTPPTPEVSPARLAQLDRALASGAKGRRFESCIARRNKGPESLGKPTGSGPFSVQTPVTWRMNAIMREQVASRSMCSSAIRRAA